MQKIRYEVDPHNRLTRLGPGKFRQVIDGEFKLDDNNSLSYHVKKSDNIDIPQQIKFFGDWSLDKGHNLILTLDKWNNQVEGNKLVLKSELLSAAGNELVFSVETRDTASSRSDLVIRGRGRTSVRVYILKFGGAWQADKYNRLSFNVTKEQGNVPGSSDQLTLQGKWEINKQNELVYTARRRAIKRGESVKNTITFMGHWDITSKDRLSYILNKDLGSRFDFKVSYEKATSDSLRFGARAGYAGKMVNTALFGKWRFDKNTGLFFEMKYAGKNGIKVEAQLSRLFLKGQGEAFIKALVSEKEYAIMAGAGWRW